jgi:hypothetical protein
MKTFEDNAQIHGARCLRASEFAKLKGFGIQTVRNWCRDGIIPSIKIGAKSLMIPLQRAEAALAKLEGGTQV